MGAPHERRHGSAPDAEPSVGPREVRAASNEMTFRRNNEAIARGRVSAAGTIGFLCECNRRGCADVIELSADGYATVRADPRRSVVAAGHGATTDTLVHDHRGCAVVAVQDGPQRTDPRTDGPLVELGRDGIRRVSFLTMQVDARPKTVAHIRPWLIAFAVEHGADQSVLDRVAVAVDEAVSNAVVHAFPRRRRGLIHVAADIEDNDLEIVVTDDGRGAQLDRSTGLGTGLSLIARSSDAFDIRERAPAGTEVWMRFALTG